MTQDLGALSGSRPTDQAPAGLGGSRFDPARTRFVSFAEMEASALVRKASGGMSTDPEEMERDVAYVLGLADKIRAQRESHAIATEAHRAETVQLGSVHEGAGPQDIAQGPSQ